MKVYRSNLMMALNVAIRKVEEEEKKSGYTMNSSFLYGIQELYDKLEKGETNIVVKD